MIVTISTKEFKYFQDRLEELILHKPDDMVYWLNVYRVISGELITLENMGVDENTYHYSTAALFIEWWKDLVNTWPIACSTAIDACGF